MTKPGIIYQMTWKTVLDNGSERTMLVKIYDKSVQIDSITGEEIVYDMTPSGHPLKISTDKSEDKFTPIRAKTATLSFLNSDSINFSTFSTGEDDRFSVTITVDGNTLLFGFVQMTDIREPFITQKDQEVTLTVVDGLTFLKGIPLTDFTGANPTGKHTIAEYIAWCLSKTGLNLNINVFNNIREENNPGRWQSAATFINPHTINVATGFGKYFKVGNTVIISGSASNNGGKFITNVSGDSITVSGTITNESIGPLITWEDASTGGCIYSTCYLDAKTFEDQIGTCVDCYTVLERILKRDCFIEQRQGNWYIFRVKELRHDFQQYQSQYANTGTFNGFTMGFNIETAIGLKPVDGSSFPIAPDSVAFFSQAQTSRVNSRPTGLVKLTYKFEMPQEIICNIDFQRGAFISTLADETDPETGNTLTAKSYDIDCWTYERNVPPIAQDSAAYIKRLFEGAYEKERFVHMPQATSADFYYLRCTDKIPLHLKDRFKIGVSFRYGTDLGGGAGHFAIHQIWCRLYGDDGTFWNLHASGGTGSSDPSSYWTQSNSSWTTNQKFVEFEGESSAVDFTQWNSISIESAVLPVSGDLEILLINNQTPNSQTKDFSSLTFEYIPIIGGSYNYKQQSNKTTITGNYKSKLEDEVFISNSPKKIFKGALHVKNNNGAYVLAGLFYDGQEFLYANDGRNHLQSYGELQVRAVHSQYRNPDEIYQLTAQGLNGYNNPDLIYRILNRDIEPASNNVVYQLLWIDQDWRNSEWEATMIKNFDVRTGFIDNDAFEFKYES